MELVIKEILPFAIGIALSPMGIAAIILMLFTQKARSNSLAFLTGWALGISLVGGVVLILVNVGVFNDGWGFPIHGSGYREGCFWRIAICGCLHGMERQNPQGREAGNAQVDDSY